MSDSDDDIGPGGSYYRSYRYMMSPEFTTFFGLDPRYRFNAQHLVRVVINYAKSHHGIVNHTLVYDKPLWRLFRLSDSQPFKIRHIDRRIQPLRNLIHPGPISEKPRPINNYWTNQVCDDSDTCDPSTPIETGSIADRVNRKKPMDGPLVIVIQGITCRRRYHGGVLQAIAYCPICQAEVNEERSLDAFCVRCARSEELVDANGNRVRFKPSTYYDQEDGYAVFHYENGEIVTRFHMGEFPCFFRGVPCVAVDTGSNDPIIVRFREKTSKVWDNVWRPDSFQPSEESVHPPTDSDWLDASYPRWSAWSEKIDQA